MADIDFGGVLALWFLAGAVCAGCAATIGEARNAGGASAAAGFFLGPLGILIALGFDFRPKCPYCFTRLNGPAEICPGCQNALEWRENEPVKSQPGIPPNQLCACPRPSGSDKMLAGGPKP